MSSRLFLSLLVLALVAVLHQQSVHVEATLLEDTCKSVSDNSHLTVNYDFCVTSLQADARTGTAPDASVLGVVAVELTLANATNAQTKIKSIVDDPSVAPATKTVLNECAGLYADMVGLINDAAKDLAAKAYTNASPKLKEGAKKSESCDFLLLEGGRSALLEKENFDSLQLVTIADLIVASLS